MAEYTLHELATLTQAKLIGNPDHLISGVENLDAARIHEAAFLENPRYEKQLAESQAGVIFIQPNITQVGGKNYLVTDHPSLAFQTVIELFIRAPQSGFSAIHPTAIIHPEAQIDPSATIGPYAVIDRGVKIGPRSYIGPHVSIGPEAILGEDCYLYPHVTVREGCRIGNRVILQPGAVIGSCGFGYFTDKKGQHIKLNQVGIVAIEDDVEIGANTTIDRARFKETRIRKGSKIDNLVQIGHQVDVGPGNIIVAQVGIAGSTKTGRFVVMGGQAGVAGHLELADGVVLAAKTGVSKSLDKPGTYGGAPAMPIKEAHLQFVQLKSIGKYIDRIKEIDAKIKSYESQFLAND